MCVDKCRKGQCYSALTVAESKVYARSAALKVYELVPEAYCQRLWTREKSGKQTHVEFGRQLVTLFSQWCTALRVDTYCCAALCHLIPLD